MRNFLADVVNAAQQVDFWHPELFWDRLKAWIEGLCTSLDVFVARLGPIVLSIIALYQAVKAKAAAKEVAKDMVQEAQEGFNQRLKRFDTRLTQVALATPPADELKEVKIVQDTPIPVETVKAN